MKNFFCSEGNIGRTPVFKEVLVNGTRKPVLEFDAKFAVDKINQESGEYEDAGGFWASVTFWGKRAEHYSKLLQTGARVVVVGELSQELYVATKGEREGQLIPSNSITARHLGVSLMSVKSIVYSGSKGKNASVNQEDSAQSYAHANSELPLPSDNLVPAGNDD